MKRQKLQLLILLALLLVCAGGYYAAGVIADRNAAQAAAAEADAYTAFTFDSTELSSLRIEGPAGTLALSYDGGDWTFVNDINAQMVGSDTEQDSTMAQESAAQEPEESFSSVSDEESEEEEKEGSEEEEDASETGETVYEVNATTASTILGYLVEITSDHQVTGAADLSEYGLDEPSMVITLSLTDGTEHTIAFGDLNEMLGEYYFHVDGADMLYTMDTYTYNILNKSDTDLAQEAEG